jgi:cytochrome c-type biogenesis protein CcmH/NrfG
MIKTWLWGASAALVIGFPAWAQVSDRVEVRAVMAAYHDAVAASPRLSAARSLVTAGSSQAVPMLQAYTRDHPGDGYGWYLLGVAHARLREEAHAAGAFARAAQAKPALRILIEEARRRKAASLR